MPTITLPKKEIDLKMNRNADDLRRILALFTEACLEAGVTAEEATGTESRPKMIGLVEKALVVLGINLEDTPILPAIPGLKFGVNPLKYRNRYRDFLFTALEYRQREDEDSAVADQIRSRFILVYELLVRLASLILCEDMEANRDGDKLIAVMGNFVGKVASTDILDSRVGLARKRERVTNFHKVLTQGGVHARWVENFQAIVAGIKKVNSNEVAIEHISTFLHSQLELVQVFLLAELKTHPKSGQFTGDHVARVLAQKERRLIENAVVTHALEAEMGESGHVVLYEKTPEQAEVELIIQGLSEAKRRLVEARVRELYQLQRQVLFLMEMVGRIQDMFKALGWLSICSGMLDLRCLRVLLQQHIDQSNALFVTPDYLGGKEVEGYFTRQLAQRTALGIQEDLNMLSRFYDDDFMQGIKTHFAASFAGLCEMQAQVPQVFTGQAVPQLVDMQRLRQVQSILAPRAPRIHAAASGGGGDGEPVRLAIEPFNPFADVGDEDPGREGGCETPPRPATPTSGDETTGEDLADAQSFIRERERAHPDLMRALSQRGVFAPPGSGQLGVKQHKLRKKAAKVRAKSGKVPGGGGAGKRF
jgi:hypothetical protein